MGPRFGRYEEVLITGACSIWLSILGSNATGVRPGSGTLSVFLAVTAVLFTVSGQFAISPGAELKIPFVVAGSVSLRIVTGLAFFTGCGAAFGFVQQL